MRCPTCEHDFDSIKKMYENIHILLLQALQDLQYAKTVMPVVYYQKELETRYKNITEKLRGEI